MKVRTKKIVYGIVVLFVGFILSWYAGNTIAWLYLKIHFG